MVVDSVQPETLFEAKEREQEKGQAGSLVLLVFTNKQDSEGAMSTPVVKDSLNLEGQASKSMQWHIRETEICFRSDIQEGFIWLNI